MSDSFLEIDNMVSAAGKEKNSPTFPLRTSKKLCGKLAAPEQTRLLATSLHVPAGNQNLRQRAIGNQQS